MTCVHRLCVRRNAVCERAKNHLLDISFNFVGSTKQGSESTHADGGRRSIRNGGAKAAACQSEPVRGTGSASATFGGACDSGPVTVSFVVLRPADWEAGYLENAERPAHAGGVRRYPGSRAGHGVQYIPGKDGGQAQGSRDRSCNDKNPDDLVKIPVESIRSVECCPDGHGSLPVYHMEIVHQIDVIGFHFHPVRRLPDHRRRKCGGRVILRLRCPSWQTLTLCLSIS